MIKIGITGSSGTLGKSLDKYLKKISKYKTINYKYDIINKKKLNNWIKYNQFQIIIHLAAIVSTKRVKKNFNYAKKINICGTKNLIEAIKNYQKKKVYLFFASSSHVYSFSENIIKEHEKLKGISKYGKTKISSEKLLLKNSNYYSLCIGRISSLCSENQTTDFLLNYLLYTYKNNKKIIFGNSNIKRNFIYVDDVSKIIIKIIRKKLVGVFNISNSESTKLSNLFFYLKKKYGFLIKHHLGRSENLVLSNKLLLKKIGNFNFLKSKDIVDKIYINKP